MRRRTALALAVCAACGGTARGQAQTAPPAGEETIQITATRFGEPVREVPGSMTVVSGDSLRARGATELRTALATVAGVSVAPGGDGGPASAVPGLLGTREIDDLLLLVDGIPAGGAFTPQLEALGLVNVERIEIIRGATPVFFGTTAFAGTINVIHYPAGRADSGLSVRYGSYGTWAAQGAMVLSNEGLKQSLALELGDERYSDARARARRAQGRWRGAVEAAGSAFHADLDLLALRQKPTSPTAIDTASGRPSAVLARDFNSNPADAKIDTDRGQLVLRHETPLSFGRWSSALSYTDTRTASVRGFVDLDDTPQPWSAATVADVEAFGQTLRQRDLFADTHLDLEPLPALRLSVGANLLTGRARADAQRYAYRLALASGDVPPAVASIAPKTLVDLADERRLLGLYAQSRWRVAPRASVLVGLRWNDTREERSEHRVTTRTGAVADYGYPADRHRRASGSLGGEWLALSRERGALNELTLHASVGNTFQLAAPEFGPSPEARPEGTRLLKPETQRSVQGGLRGDAFDNLVEFDLTAFHVDFGNQPLLGRSGGTPVLRPGGRQRYRGADADVKLRPAPAWTLSANAGWSDARYRDFVTEIDGVATQLAGKQQILTPRLRAGAGAVYAPESGWRGSLTLGHTGARWLDERNRWRASAYTLVDASLGYRFGNTTLQLAGSNLGNRRDLAQTSELGEGQYYRLPGRRVMASVAVAM